MSVLDQIELIAFLTGFGIAREPGERLAHLRKAFRKAVRVQVAKGAMRVADALEVAEKAVRNPSIIVVSREEYEAHRAAEKAAMKVLLGRVKEMEEQYQAKLALSFERVEGFKEELNALRAKHEETVTHSNNQTAQLEWARSEMTALEEKLKVAQADVIAWKTRHSDMKGLLSGEESRGNSDRRALAQAKSDAEALRQRVKMLEEKDAIREKAYSDLERDHDALEARVEELSSKEIARSAERDAARRELAHVAKERDELELKLVGLRDDLVLANARIAQAELTQTRG